MASSSDNDARTPSDESAPKRRRKRVKRKREAEEEAPEADETEASEAAPPAEEAKGTEGSEEAEPEGTIDAGVDEVAEGAEDDEDGAGETPLWTDIRNFYLSFDRRTLGLSRILLAFFLIFDLLRRTPDWWKMFSNEGVLPTHYNLWRPQSGGWSLLNGFTERQDLYVLWAVILGVYVMLLLGYKTKVWQIAAAIIVPSLNGRVLLIENGGYVVHNLLLLWTVFMPMGDRFSLDSLIASWKTQRERGVDDLNERSTDTARWRLKPWVSLVGLVLLLQLACIYFFNVVHKTGPNWHNGTAVHYVSYVDRMATPLVAAVRDLAPWWLLWFLAHLTMALEAGMSVALFSPLARTWARRCAITFIVLMHVGFGSTFVLGPFAWALCVFATLLFTTDDWNVAYRTMKRLRRARTVRYSPRSEVSFFWCRLLKRLDRFELLSFETDKKANGLEVSTPSGERKSGLDATLDIIAALPLGPIIAEPCRLPVLRQLFGIDVAVAGGVARMFFPSEKRAEPQLTAPLGYVGELRDDIDQPTIDSHFMHDWLKRYYGGNFRMLYVNLGITAVGFFTFVWLSELLRTKLEFKAKAVLWGTPLDGYSMGAFTREDAIFWVGLLIFAVGAYRFVKPLVLMNLRTPSGGLRKLIRVRAFTRECLVMLCWIAAINQGVVELWKFRPYKLPQPTLTRVLTHKMRYLQGWFMFSPNPVMDDGITVVDAITVDGRRVDPFTTDTYWYKLEPPYYDLLNARSFAYNQIWSDYFNRMHLPANTSFRKPMQEYLYRLPERTGNPDDAIVKGTVYWISDRNPRWGRRDSYGYHRKELFKFVNPNQDVQRRYKETQKRMQPAWGGHSDPPPLPLPVKETEPSEEEAKKKTNPLTTERDPNKAIKRRDPKLPGAKSP